MPPKNSSNQTVAGLKSRGHRACRNKDPPFKSDRGGIEIHKVVTGLTGDLQFKSDRGGIEMNDPEYGTYNEAIVQIRPWRD